MSVLALDAVVTAGGLGPVSTALAAGGETHLAEPLARVAIGLETPARGAVALFGRPLAALDAEGARALRREVAVIPRDPVLMGNLDIRENVALPLRYHRAEREPAIARRVDACLAEHGLAALAGARPHALTAGQRRAVARVRALLAAPRLLLVVDDGTALDARLCDDVRGRGGAVVHLSPGTR